MKTPQPATMAGVTLLELMLAITILGVLAAMAFPSLNALVRDTSVSLERDRMWASINLARSRALSTGKRVVLCPSRDGQHCLATTEWQAGWIMFSDTNEDRNRQTDEPLIRAESSLAEGIIVKTTSGRKRLTLRPSGMAYGSNVTMTFCDTTGTASPHALVLSNTGRARAALRKPDKSPLDCS